MKRREFMAGLGGAIAWPALAGAQRPMPVIGYLSSGSANISIILEPFRQGLKESGFVEGQNVSIEYRWADGRRERLPTMAADLVNRRVAVIATTGGMATAIAAKAATATIPIVFQGGGDAVRLGLVASLNHPGGNVTGAMPSATTLETKAVQYLRDLVPAAALLGVLVNRINYPSYIETEAAARELHWEYQIFEASTDEDLKTAFEAMAKRKVGAMNVDGDFFFTSRRAQIVALAAQYAIPASYYFREFVIAGGLMSYGTDLREQGRVAGNYVGRIPKGEKPADLPVQQSTKIELAINLKTAKVLGLTVPPNLLAVADEVIE
jgi:putative tryptophan/tyrosine transport system substrate-binding protein